MIILTSQCVITWGCYFRGILAILNMLDEVDAIAQTKYEDLLNMLEMVDNLVVTR